MNNGQSEQFSVADILHWVEMVSLGIELLAISIIVLAIIYATLRYIYENVRQSREQRQYDHFKRRLGRALLLGLEVLVAADIIRTVALDATLDSVLVLGLLIVIRTFLSWALIVEIEGRWPWQQRSARREDEEEGLEPL